MCFAGAKHVSNPAYRQRSLHPHFIYDCFSTLEVDGVEVTAMDANHCPGAVMFHFFDPRTGKTALHVGDFRGAPCVCDDTTLAAKLHMRPVDTLYLDTTYSKPNYVFLPQEDALQSLRDIVAFELDWEPKIVFVVGSFSIGKERAIEDIAEAADSQVLVGGRKHKMLQMCERNTKI